MRRALVSVAALAALSQAGCSLTGLSDFKIFECHAHSECEPLNGAHGIAADACVRYQCAADSHCRLQPVDLDRDGHATVACASAPECGDMIACDDCDDTAANAYPGQSEVCDGVDNDCNLIIDDLGSAGTAAGETTVVTGAANVAWHGYGAPLAGSTVAALSFSGTMMRGPYFNVIERDTTDPKSIGTRSANISDLGMPSNTMQMGCPSDIITVPAPTTPVGSGVTVDTCQTHEDCSDGVLCNGFELCDPSAAMVDARGCRTDRTEPACPGAQCNEGLGICELGGLGVTTGCNFAEMVGAESARAGGDTFWFGAAVQQTGCGNLVRIGYYDEGVEDQASNDPGRNVLFRGDYHRSTSYRGIDMISVMGPDTTMNGRCTGRSRPTEQPLGAHGIALGALPADVDAGRRRPQALAAWLVPVASGGQPVEAIGIWQEEFPSLRWVNATGDAIPQSLQSDAVGDVRPALASWTGASKAGYFVAYGASGGGIAIRFVPAFGDPAEVGANPPYTTAITAGATEHRTTPTIELGVEQSLTTGGEALGVQLVVGRTSGDTVTLGLAWREAGNVRFSIVTFDGATASFDQSPPAAVASDADGEIALGYTAGGLVLPGFQRGSATADESSSGGWLLAWRTGGKVHGARFAELDGQALEPAVMHLANDVSRLHVYVGSAGNDAGSQRSVPRLVYHDTAAQEFRRTDAFCGPAL